MGACINSILDDCSLQIVYQFLVISVHFRCGESLAHVFSSPEVQSYLFGDSEAQAESGKEIFLPGTLRKVRMQ